jgi:broad specificity phosphatase PhoE
MSEIYLIRHGQSTWNSERRWAGQANPPLTEIGRQQVILACEKFQEMDFSAVTSSSLQRARETASIIAESLKLKLLAPISDLNERQAGEIGGLTSDEIEGRFPGLLDKWRKGEIIDIPGGENWDAFIKRVQNGLQALSLISGRILAVSHEGILRAIEYLSGENQRKHENLEGRWITISYNLPNSADLKSRAAD